MQTFMGAMELIIGIVVLGLIFDYTNGFHDAANVVSTVIATKALLPITAIVLAGILNTFGALQAGGVAETIAKGIVKPEDSSQLMTLSALIGAIFWNLLTWYYGIPSSSSYALIGGLIGAALTFGGGELVLWKGLIYKVIIPMVVSPFLGFGIAYCFMKLLFLFTKKSSRDNHRGYFRYLQIFSSSLVALAHGMNDAQKSMGIITLGLFTAGRIATPHIPVWVVLACAITIGLGTASGGFRIIRTIGYRITKLQPAQGFAAEASSSLVILAASLMGMPISSTHMIVGSVTGVGSAKGRGEVRWELSRRLVVAWLFTIPGSAIIAAAAYFFLSFFI